MEHLFRHTGNNGNGKMSEYVVRAIDDTNQVGDAVELKIEQDIPIPPSARGHYKPENQGFNNPMVSVLLEMNINDSMAVPPQLAIDVRNAVTTLRYSKNKKQASLKFLTRTNPKDVKKYKKGDRTRPFRIWRTA